MKRFEIIKVIGDGAFGTVMKCRDKETGELVAIKKFKQKFKDFDECLQLKEVKSLRKIKHENVERLLQVFRENENFYMVFELLQGSLLNTMETHSNKFKESEIRYIMHQLLTGLHVIHKQGFFHRDIKPDNLLWGGTTLKIADFGLAREIRSRPPYTEYISTRWYRAPEIILRHKFYNSPVDIWAAACIMAELYMGKPLFQGTSETDQMYKICSIMGNPTPQNWPDSEQLILRMGFRLPQTSAVPLQTLMPDASPQAIDLLYQMLRYDPAKRPSANQALSHPFFDGPMEPPVLEQPVEEQTSQRSKLNASKLQSNSMSTVSKVVHINPQQAPHQQQQNLVYLNQNQNTQQKQPYQNTTTKQTPFSPSSLGTLGSGTTSKAPSYLSGIHQQNQYPQQQQKRFLYNQDGAENIQQTSSGRKTSLFDAPYSNTPFVTPPKPAATPSSRLGGLIDKAALPHRFGNAGNRLIGGFVAHPMGPSANRPVPMEGTKSAKPEFKFDDDLFY